MGQLGSLAKNVRGYYSKAFGPFNQHFRIQNHTFVGLDAPGLVDEDYQRSGRGISFDRWTPIEDGPISFVKQEAIGMYLCSFQDLNWVISTTSLAEHPVILLSHIPLARSTSASCGPLRERGTIRRDVGHGYQSMLGKQTTHFLLETLQPSIVFRFVLYISSPVLLTLLSIVATIVIIVIIPTLFQMSQVLQCRPLQFEKSLSSHFPCRSTFVDQDSIFYLSLTLQHAPSRVSHLLQTLPVFFPINQGYTHPSTERLPS